MRRATLRGLENLNKRHQIAAACYNLSELLRRLYGVGMPKQWAACLSLFRACWRHAPQAAIVRGPSARLNATLFVLRFSPMTAPANPGSSTAC